MGKSSTPRDRHPFLLSHMRPGSRTKSLPFLPRDRYYKPAFFRDVSSIPFILKSTWCLTSTETIRLIRDGAFHPSDAHPFHRGFLVDFFQETSTRCPKNLPPPVSLATHFSQETPTLYPQDLRPPVSLARSTPIFLLRHPSFTYRIYLHPFSFHRDISASSSVVLGHAFCHELTNYPFLS